MILLETYLRELSEIQLSRPAVKETSYYGPLAKIDKTIKPR